MKRIKLIITLLLSIVTIASFAQSTQNSKKFMLGVFSGLNFPKLMGGHNNVMSSGYTPRSEAIFGVTSNLDLGSNLALRADLLYSSEGGKRNGFQAFDASTMGGSDGSYFYATFNNESDLDYLTLPVLLKYSIPFKSSKFYIDFGPYAGYLLTATEKTSGSSMVYADKAKITPVVTQPVSFNATTDIKSSIHKMSFGLTGGIGYAQQVGKDQLILDVRGAYGLTYVQKYAFDGKSHSGYLEISLGYSVPL